MLPARIHPLIQPGVGGTARALLFRLSPHTVPYFFLWVPPITYWFQPSLDDTIHQLEPTPSPGIDRPTRLSFVPATYPPIDSYPTLLLTYRLSQEDEGQH